MINPPKKFDDKTNGRDTEKALRKQTFKLPAEQWHQLEQHILAIREIVKNAETLDPDEITKGSGLPALTYRGCVFAMDPADAKI